MNGTIRRIIPVGDSFMYLIRIGDKKDYGRTYTGKKYRNFAHWKDLKVGDEVIGLVWKDEKKKIIDADSLVDLQ